MLLDLALGVAVGVAAPEADAFGVGLGAVDCVAAGWVGEGCVDGCAGDGVGDGCVCGGADAGWLPDGPGRCAGIGAPPPPLHAASVIRKSQPRNDRLNAVFNRIVTAYNGGHREAH